MAIQTISSADSISVESVKILIYGQPGLGKTTISLTAQNPLILDFDLGAHRAGNRNAGTVIRIDSWNDIGELMRNSKKYLGPYDTIIIDTVGRCLDYLTAQIIADDPKSGNRNGGLTMSGWGSLKGAFSAWIKQLVLLNKDVIMIAHDKEEKGDNDVRILRPDVPGGSYAEVLKQADFVGYMFKGLKDVSFLNFNPTEKTIGKNSAKFPILEIPDVTSNPHFLAEKITEMKDKLSGMSAQDLKVRELISVAKAKILTYKTAAEFNDTKSKLSTIPEPAQSQIRTFLWKTSQEMAIPFNKDKGVFEEPAPVNPSPGINVNALLNEVGNDNPFM